MKPLWTLVLLGLVALATPALAQPLTLSQVQDLQTFLECRLPCDYGKVSARAACMKACPI